MVVEARQAFNGWLVGTAPAEMPSPPEASTLDIEEWVLLNTHLKRLHIEDVGFSLLHNQLDSLAAQPVAVDTGHSGRNGREGRWL